MAFQQLAGVALPYEQMLHFRCVSWRAKSFAWQLTKRKCSLCSQGRVVFAITRFITFQRLRFYNLLAYRDLVFLTLLPRQENRLFSVSWGSICVKTQSHFLAFRSLRRRWRLQWSGGGVSPLPGSFLVPRSIAKNGVSWSWPDFSFYGQCRIVNLFCAQKFIFPESLIRCITLMYCKSLKFSNWT